ncbi:MAG TPA: hypothetical protein VK458_25370 [Myxococcaceae bacterium]|nr:hypothetical protein [Myxococcaceae bacterium]
MKKQLLSAVMLCTLGVVGCGEDNAGPVVDTGPKYNTPDKVRTFLEGKTLVMEGANIPSHPNGISENVLFDPSTQCYNKVTMLVASGNLQVTSVRAVIEGATTQGSTGTCNRAMVRDTLAPFTSTTLNIENVKSDGTCFDITATYNGFAQEGRGVVTQDGTKVQLELFFSGQATGHRCVDGAVGAKTITTSRGAFTGNAVQTYAVQQ